jgi:hypothetical protein
MSRVANIIVDSVSIIFGILSLTLSYVEIWFVDINFDIILNVYVSSKPNEISNGIDLMLLLMFIMGMLTIIGIFVNFVNVLLEINMKNSSKVIPFCIYFITSGLLSVSIAILYSSEYPIKLRAALFFTYLLFLLSISKLFIKERIETINESLDTQI